MVTELLKKLFFNPHRWGVFNRCFKFDEPFSNHTHKDFCSILTVGFYPDPRPLFFILFILPLPLESGSSSGSLLGGVVSSSGSHGSLSLFTDTDAVKWLKRRRVHHMMLLSKSQQQHNAFHWWALSTTGYKVTAKRA